MTEIDGFTQMIDDANAFFVELKNNNNRDWFEPRKEHFVENVRKPGEFFASLLAEEISRKTGQPHKGKLYRIYRDVRFSKDKTPYNAHFHVSADPIDRDTLAPVFFFASEPGEMALYIGMVGFQGERLLRYRAFIDKWGDRLEEEREAAGAVYAHFGPPALKRVPAPYDKDHPHGELLKRKSLILKRDMDDSFRKIGLLKAVLDEVDRFKPLHSFISERL
ncbi:MAG: DUF2461 domain-containing protein [Pseudomonadota bacterium]